MRHHGKRSTRKAAGGEKPREAAMDKAMPRPLPVSPPRANCTFLATSIALLFSLSVTCTGAAATRFQAERATATESRRA